MDMADKKTESRETGGAREREEAAPPRESPLPESRPPSPPSSDAPRATFPRLANGRPGRETDTKTKEAAKPQTQGKTSERTLFKTTAAWFAFVRTESNGKAQLEFRFPDDLTDWKITARAIDPHTKIGELQIQASTRKPVMVMVRRSAFLVEKDRVRLELSARNSTSTAQNLSLSMEVKGGVQVEKSLQRIHQVLPGEWLRTYAMLSATGVGNATLSAHVQGEYSDSLEETLPVLPHGIKQSRGQSGILQQKATKMAALTLPSAYHTQGTKLTIRLFPGYASAMRECLKMLIEYPYGCVEQTMSRFMPNLVAARVFQQLHSPHPQLQKDMDKFVHVGLARLYQAQNADGSWGWWANDHSHAMMSAYVMSGLGRARSLGYRVDEKVRSKGLSFLQNRVGQGRLSYAEKAYILYALALHDVLTTSTVDKFFDQEERLKADPYTLSLLTLSLVKVGREAEARITLQELLKQTRMAGDAYTYWGTVGEHRWDKNAIEVTAMCIRAMLAVEPEHTCISSALQWLMAQRIDVGWHSTKDTSEVVLTLCAYLEQKKKKDTRAETVTILVNETLQKVSVENDTVTCVFPGSALKAGANDISFLCDNPGQIFYSAYLEYFTTEIPIAPSDCGFTVKRLYTVLREEQVSGQLKYRRELLQPEVAPGSYIMIALTVECPKAYDFVVLEDSMPATAMPVRDDRDIHLVSPLSTTRWVHREFHHHKAVFFFTRLPAGTHTVYYFFRPGLAGRFHALPAEAYLMYYPEVRGNSDEMIFEVK
jgi:uncharacterized protein YfaS (alpha-2-macroglobulin family)